MSISRAKGLILHEVNFVQACPNCDVRIKVCIAHYLLYMLKLYWCWLPRSFRATVAGSSRRHYTEVQPRALEVKDRAFRSHCTLRFSSATREVFHWKNKSELSMNRCFLNCIIRRHARQCGTWLGVSDVRKSYWSNTFVSGRNRHILC